jgi:hypothetical protein
MCGNHTAFAEPEASQTRNPTNWGQSTGFHVEYSLSGYFLMEATPFLFEIPLDALLRYLAEETQSPEGPEMLLRKEARDEETIDWHRVLRQGLQCRLHINLGIPGIEEPAHPIEENPAALYAAMAMGAESLDVILSGELERAVEAGLIEDSALDNLRNEIRVSG